MGLSGPIILSFSIFFDNVLQFCLTFSTFWLLDPSLPPFSLPLIQSTFLVFLHFPSCFQLLHFLPALIFHYFLGCRSNKCLVWYFRLLGSCRSIPAEAYISSTTVTQQDQQQAFLLLTTFCPHLQVCLLCPLFLHTPSSPHAFRCRTLFPHSSPILLHVFNFFSLRVSRSFPYFTLFLTMFFHCASLFQCLNSRHPSWPYFSFSLVFPWT